jgi:flagellar biosynthesis anti-sigma factor FlgM
MVGIQGLGGIPEPKSGGPSKTRNERETIARDGSATSAASSGDDVSISSEARAAAEIGRLAVLAKTQDDIRADRVAQAKQNIEKGLYKDPEVVAKVAEKLLKYLG